MRVSSAIAQALVDHGVDTLFGLMGDANMLYITDFMRDCGGRYIGAVHEGGAVSMAAGYARATGSVGVATVTHGPGLTNCTTALIEASRAQLPLLLLTADTPAGRQHYNQWLDLAGWVAPTGAAFRRVRRAQDVLDGLGRAVHQSTVERRPVVFDIPVDFVMDEVEYQPPRFTAFARQPQEPSADDLDKILGVLATVRRPVILAGTGALDSSARAAIVRLANLLGAPVGTTVPAKDLFAGEPCAVGVIGTVAHPPALEVMQRADCVVAFGASLNDYTTVQGALLRDKYVIQIDHDMHRLAMYGRADLCVVGDARLSAERMVDALTVAGFASKGVDPLLRERVARFDPLADVVDRGRAGTVDIRIAMAEFSRVLPSDRTVVTDAGRFLHAVWQHLQMPDPRRNVQTHHFGSIGLGVATAVGASAVRPEQLTVAVVGDGGGMMGLVEFQTAVHHRLPLLVIVLDDGCYGSEYTKLSGFGVDPAYSLREWPEFADLARAYGGNGLTVRSRDEIASLDPAVFELDQLPLLIDVKADPAIDPEA